MCEHLKRRGTRCAIRRKSPADLVAYYGRTIYTKALGTSDYSEAKRLCRLLAVALGAEWQKARASQRGEEPPVEAPVQPVLLPKLAGCSLKPRREAIARAEPKGTTMLAVARKWALERKPAARTVSRTYNIVEEFRRHTGCSIIEQATREHVLKFKDALLEAGQTPGNINVKIPMLGVVFNYACDNAIIKANPASRVRIDDKRRASEKRLNWCVTKPWFDYIMGTRVIADPAIAETNPLAVKLPAFVEKRVNALARRLLPKAYALIDAASAADAQRRQQGVALPDARGYSSCEHGKRGGLLKSSVDEDFDFVISCGVARIKPHGMHSRPAF